MHDQWMEDLEDGKTVAVTLVDQSAAFDVCNHIIILNKLMLMLKLLGLDSVDWMTSYLSSRTQSVAIGAALSAPLALPTASGAGWSWIWDIIQCEDL